MKGSPPHMRGKGKSLCDDLQRVGITPAYAGKSTAGAAFDRAVEDHPRICGEKRIASSSAGGRPGSPPHMRGKVPITGCLAPCVGITPAYAGKRLRFSPLLCGRWDHPRICGEKSKYLSAISAVLGSPPHMRGKAMFASCSIVSPGITPAYAGKRRGLGPLFIFA